MSEFDAYRNNYEADINSAISFSGKSHEFFTRVKADVLSRYLAALPRQERLLEVLDVGCGHGAIHPALAKIPCPIKLTGIDVASQVLDMARTANPGIDYLDYDGKRFPFESGSFDAAFTICVMHHVPPTEWLSFMLEMRRVVRPGGLLMVIEHNPFNPLTSYIVKTCALDANAVLLRASRLHSLMREAGLIELQRKFFLFLPFDGNVASRLNHSLRWLPLGAQYVAIGRVPN
jgi:SAM-dependent methyltransferase